MATYHETLADLKKHLESERTGAHQDYLNNWETKTLFAEGQPPEVIQERVIMTIESLASTVDHLALLSLSLLEFVEPLIEKANIPE